MEKLLSRSDFRDAVFARDKHACVICGSKATEGAKLDAHHILERRLFSDGGYYLSNGATLCDADKDGCHYKAESTEISVEEIRLACRISRPIIPDDLYPDHVYDKWGNAVLADGRRSKGPLFHDESVQKILNPSLHLYTDYVKYPRTWHLPFSPGATNDDRMLKNCQQFEGKEVVVTRKMDGENFSGYRDYSHARSIDGRSHPSRDWVKNFWMNRSYELPQGWRVTCENLYAVHSLRYKDLPGYLLGFAIWDDRNVCLSWDDTLTWYELLDIPVVETLYRGTWNENLIKSLHTEERDSKAHEGYVVRLSSEFAYSDFSKSLAKYVRSNHVQTVKHWMHGQRIEANGLK